MKTSNQAEGQSTKKPAVNQSPSPVAFAGDLKPALDAVHRRASRQFHRTAHPQEWKLVALRECSTDLPLCDNSLLAVDYWRKNIQTHPFFNPECECFAVILLNTQRRIKGHCFISTGNLDTVLVHPREVFRVAVVTSASAIIMAHNHPSGDPMPSDSDVRVTRELIAAGRLMKIEVLDHIIIGCPRFVSLRESGLFL